MLVALTGGDFITCLCGDGACLATLTDAGLAPSTAHVRVACAHRALYRTLFYIGLLLGAVAAALEVAIIIAATRLLDMPWRGALGFVFVRAGAVQVYGAPAPAAEAAQEPLITSAAPLPANAAAAPPDMPSEAAASG